MDEVRVKCSVIMTPGRKEKLLRRALQTSEKAGEVRTLASE